MTTTAQLPQQTPFAQSAEQLGKHAATGSRNVANIQVFDASMVSRAYSTEADIARGLRQQQQKTPRKEVGAPATPVGPGYYHSASQFSQKVELYRGSVSTVFKAVHDATGARVILKCYHKKKMADKHYHKLEREIRAMVALRGPYVADLYGWFTDGDAIWLVLELCEGGDLFKTMMLHGGRLDEHYVCVEIIAPLLRVLEKSHRMNLMHRDIKPENIFLTRASKFKLGDWGLAINWTQEIPFSRSGTLDYMAPEVLRNPASQMQESKAVAPAVLAAKGITPYTSQVDVWAVGVLAYELVVGKPPFEVEDEAQTASLIMYSNSIRYPSAHSAPWADFVKSVLVKDPAVRPSAGDLMNHPWITSNLHKAISAAAAAGRHSSKEGLMRALPLPTLAHQQAAAEQPLPGFVVPPPAPKPAPAAPTPAAPVAAPAPQAPAPTPTAAQASLRPASAAGARPQSAQQPSVRPPPSPSPASASARPISAHKPGADRTYSGLPPPITITTALSSASSTASFISACSTFECAAAAINGAGIERSRHSVPAAATPTHPQQHPGYRAMSAAPLQRQASNPRPSPLSKSSGGGSTTTTTSYAPPANPEPTTPTRSAIHTSAFNVPATAPRTLTYAADPPPTPTRHHPVAGPVTCPVPPSPTPCMSALMAMGGAHGAVTVNCPGSAPPASKLAALQLQYQQSRSPTSTGSSGAQGAVPKLSQHLAALRVPDSPTASTPVAQWHRGTEEGAQYPGLQSPAPGPGIKQRALFHLQRQAMAVDVSRGQ